MFSNRMRITGLSGFDTETMVNNLMQAESYKYDKLLKQASFMTYQQAAYRSVGESLKAFQEKFLMVGRTGSLNMPGTFVSKSSSIMFNGTASTDIGAKVSTAAKNGNYKLTVKHVARKDVWESAGTFNPSMKGAAELEDTLQSLYTPYRAPVADDPATADIDESQPEVQEGYSGLNFALSLDGAAGKRIEFSETEIADIFDDPGNPGVPNTANFEDALNDKLNAAFGTDSAAGGAQKVSASVGADGVLSISVLPGHSATIKGTEGVSMGALGLRDSTKTEINSSNMTADNFFGNNNSIEIETNSGTLTLNKADYAGKTMTDLVNDIKEAGIGVSMAYNKDNGTYSISSSGTGDVSNFSITGDVDNNAFTNTIEAQDAVVSFNGGRDISFETNNFTIEGIAFTLNENSISKVDNPGTTVDGADDVAKTFDVTVANDNTKLKDLIMDFVSEYNKLVKTMNDHYMTNRPKSVTGDYYEPLTDQEKEAMSDTQIENWEEKAQQGILYRDEIMDKTLRSLRNQMMDSVTLPDGSKISLMSIGISTSGKVNDGGQLVVDEEKLDKALTERADDIQTLFTKSADRGTGDVGNSKRFKSEGLAERLDDIITMTVGSKGTITKKAGMVNTASEKSNEMFNDLKDQNEKIADMLTYLQDKEDYYYRMFSKMEQAMAEGESQMAQIQGMFGG